MGHRTKRFKFFAPTSRDALVPADHFYRQLKAKLDLSFVRDLARDCYEELGRPSIDPVGSFELQRGALGGQSPFERAPHGCLAHPSTESQVQAMAARPPAAKIGLCNAVQTLRIRRYQPLAAGKDVTWIRPEGEHRRLRTS